ncbi:Flagellar basal-body rod modification protein FlgD [hydrothermal vent metagenome]|uniref:Flagellar basal-body rod modification protein FlgD n=1 Tax=hydrothermal vent metagenome TaxID=652676 RepID=A0A3B0YDA3_9ZZZZ
MIDIQNGAQGIEFRSVQDLNKESSRKELGQEQFLQLMTTQLQNQDPFKPMESGDFLTQIAQFSTVEGIGELNTGFEQLSNSLVSNQALQAASLIGRSVLAPTGVAALEQGGSIRGNVELPAASGEVTVSIFDQSGQLVRRLDLGSQAEGDAEFQWDGLRDDGQFAQAGNYFVSAEASIDGRNEAINTLLVSEVRSVTLSNSGGLLLDLDGIGALDFKEVRQIL